MGRDRDAQVVVRFSADDSGVPSVPPGRAVERAARAVLLIGTGLLYVVGLDRSGWGNSFYAAAAQAGSRSWTALFFGSSDAGNSITVDKPPASLWLMGLSVRVFGLSSWSLLVPEALIGVAAVALLAATVRRAAGPWPGLLAGLLLALTPVATLMFRYDNPDGLLTLLVVAAAWTTGRAVDDGRLRWTLATGALLGLAFLTKSLQAFLVVPALAAVLLLCGRGSLRRRFGHLAAGGAALVVTAGWWLGLVLLIPPSDRPWVGGSTDDSPLQLAFGYNGLGRLAGERGPSGHAVVYGGSAWRLVGSAGDQVGWLLPAAVLGLCVAPALVRGRSRTDPVRAAVLMCGGWAVVTAVVLSAMQGIWHPYYTVELAPALAAVVALSATLLWRRGTMAARMLLAGGSAVTTVWSVSLVERRLPAGSAVEWAVAAVGTVAVVGLLVLAASDSGLTVRTGSRVVAGAVVAAAVAGPFAWSLATAELPHRGAAVTAGPVVGSVSPQGRASVRPTAATRAAVSLIRQDPDDWTWAAATIGHRAADLQLASGAPVMPVGGFAGADPAPTLPRFEADVSAHRVHWYVPSAGGTGAARDIDAWARAHGRPVVVGRTTLYDLSGLATVPGPDGLLGDRGQDDLDGQRGLTG